MIRSSKIHLFSLLFGIITILKIVHPPISFAMDCGVAKISPDSSGQNWNLSYCFSSKDKNEVLSASSVKVTCRSSPLGTPNLSCHESSLDPLFIGYEAVSQTQSIAGGKIGQNADGSYFSCFTIESLNRNLGNIEISVSDPENRELCNDRADVKPGDYGWLEYFDQTLESRFGIDLIDTSTEGNVFCLDKASINTALGCIPTEPTKMINTIIRISLGLGGGIALLLILYGVFIITTSSGIPDKLNAGKDIITSAISGLVIIALSIVILNLIGTKILAIPGL